VWPIGLPARDYPTERGVIEIGDAALHVTQAKPGSRLWLPVLLSWHPERDKAEIHWRQLTISQRRKVCRPGVGFAARVGWKGEPHSLVIYRSLGPPAARVFLGHQTTARFLIGLFSPEGRLKPLVNIE
jgi:hypothetical protein